MGKVWIVGADKEVEIFIYPKGEYGIGGLNQTQGSHRVIPAKAGIQAFASLMAFLHFSIMIPLDSRLRLRE